MTSNLKRDEKPTTHSHSGGGYGMLSVPPPYHLYTRQRVETIVRTEYIPDTVLVEVPVESERQTVRDTTSHLETSFATSDARINADGSLSHSLANKPQKKPVPTEKEVVYRDSLVYRDKIVEKAVPVERELTWWQQTQMRGFWIVLAIIVVVYRKKIFAVVRRFI